MLFFKAAYIDRKSSAYWRYRTSRRITPLSGIFFCLPYYATKANGNAPTPELKTRTSGRSRGRPLCSAPNFNHLTSYASGSNSGRITFGGAICRLPVVGWGIPTIPIFRSHRARPQNGHARAIYNILDQIYIRTRNLTPDCKCDNLMPQFALLIGYTYNKK